MSDHHVESVSQRTPDSKNSRPFRIVSILIISIILAVSCEKLMDKKNEGTTYGGINSTDKYTLLDTKYREALVINLEPNHSAKVDLTNDYCTSWSSDQVNVYDNNGYLRIMEGEKYVKGVSAENSLVYTFTNKSKKNVIVKVWRYVDESDYILHHKH